VPGEGADAATLRGEARRDRCARVAERAGDGIEPGIDDAPFRGPLVGAVSATIAVLVPILDPGSAALTTVGHRSLARTGRS
jgi:hypothetical protein